MGNLSACRGPAAAAAVVALLLAGCGPHPASAGSAAPGSAPSPTASSTPTPGMTPTPTASPSTGSAAGGAPAPTASGGRQLQLPRGGRQIFPAYRLVGYAGAPGSTAFGRLGIGRIDDRVNEIEKLGRQYRAGREVLPVLELIADVAQHFPGDDGMYRVRMGDGVIAGYLAAARRHHALLLLDVPGEVLGDHRDELEHGQDVTPGPVLPRELLDLVHAVVDPADAQAAERGRARCPGEPHEPVRREDLPAAPRQLELRPPPRTPSVRALPPGRAARRGRGRRRGRRQARRRASSSPVGEAVDPGAADAGSPGRRSRPSAGRWRRRRRRRAPTCGHDTPRHLPNGG